MRIFEGKHDAYVTFERSGMWWVCILRGPDGNVQDKVRCGDYFEAIAYRKAFIKVARAG